MQNSNQKDRLVFREKVARDLGVILNPPLTFRAAKFAAQFSSRDEVVRWLNRPNTLNTWQMGRKTYNELCQVFGLAIPTHGPRTLGARLRAAEARIAELEQELARFMELHDKEFLTVGGATTEECSVDHVGGVTQMMKEARND